MARERIPQSKSNGVTGQRKVYQSKNMHYIYNKEYFDGIFESELSEKKKEELFSEKGNMITQFSYPQTIGEKSEERFHRNANNTTRSGDLTGEKQTGQELPIVGNLIDTLEKAYGKSDDDSKDHSDKHMDKERGSKAFIKIEMRTTYPGLLIGLGYPHDTKEKGAIAGGFSFDYTTGLPYIPGSTVKGMLRSYFPGQRTKNQNAYRKFIAQVLSEVFKESKKENPGPEELEKYVDTLEELLFEKDNIYFGGYPLLDKRSKKNILAEEYITPHKPLKNPKVIKLLKVGPDVKFAFLFVLHDCKLDDKLSISSEQIKALFEQLLELGGVGAKTNVGYSQFELCDNQ